MVDIDQLVDQTLEGRPEATKTKKTRTKRFIRLVGAGGGITGLAKALIVFGVTAALISTMIGTYIISQTDEITLEGRESYDLWVDGVPVGRDDFVMPPDTFTDDKLVWGETETFVHTFYSPPLNGNFSIEIDQSWQTWLQPGHEADEFYGYRMYCLNETGEEITSFKVLTGEPAREITFVHELDTHFAETPNPLPYALTLEVSEYNWAPTAEDDGPFTVGLYDTITVHPLVNDFDPEQAPLTITSVDTSSMSPFIEVTIAPDGQSLSVYNNWNLVGTASFTYTITDSAGNTDSAYISLVMTE